jgi:type IV secretory pathway VirB10-like protein
VTYLRPNLSECYPSNLFPTDQNILARAVLLSVISLAAVPLLAQEPQSERPSPPAQQNVVTVPAGTRIPLVLTHPVQSRVIHRGDDIYAQVTAPVRSGDQMVIPPGTFVQGTVDKLDARGGRGQLHLQSMSIIFPDG